MTCHDYSYTPAQITSTKACYKLLGPVFSADHCSGSIAGTRTTNDKQYIRAISAWTLGEMPILQPTLRKQARYFTVRDMFVNAAYI